MLYVLDDNSIHEDRTVVINILRKISKIVSNSNRIIEYKDISA